MNAERVAVVTGGSRGIGRAIARRLAQDGARLSLWARTAGELESTADEIRDGGGEAIAVPTDVSDWDSVTNATELTIKAFGRIDILVNNAAVTGATGTVAEVDPQEWAGTLAIDLVGPFYCMRAVLPGMIAQGGGKVVNITGGGAGEPFPEKSAYGTAKTALVRLTETVAYEMQEHNIQVNVVSPGLVVTRLNEDALHDFTARDPERAARFRELLETQSVPPEEGAELVAFLASSRADAITGRWLTVYDGWQELAQDPQRLSDEDLYVLRRYPR